MVSSFTHKINFYKNVNGLGWQAQSFKTTKNELALHLSSLAKKSDVRCIDVVELK